MHTNATRTPRPVARPTVRLARRGERGMTTSEYAVGTVGACGVGGILYQLANSDFFTSLLQDVIGKVLDLLPF